MLYSLEKDLISIEKMSGFLLLKNFIKSPTSVGSVWPSSPILADNITTGIDIEKSSSIVELGPGTGVITKYIIKKKKNNARFFVVELNPELCNVVKDKYPTIKVYNESAANLELLKNEEKLEHIETIISGLPWISFPTHVQTSIMEVIHSSLKPGGIFTTFAYIQGALLPSAIKFRKLLKKYFFKVESSKVVWRNIPPAFIYRCVK